MSSALKLILDKPFFYFFLLAVSIYLGHHIYSKEWIDSALLMSRVAFVFIIFSSIKKLPVKWALPASVFLGPFVDLVMDYFESSLMEIVRFFIGNAVNPQFILIGLTILLLVYISLRTLINRSLRYFFLFILLVANISASSVFHYTQVDRFIYLQDERMYKQVDVLYESLLDSEFKEFDKICNIYQITCVYGNEKVPPKGIEKEFHPMFKEVVGSDQPTYRTMRKFNATESDPTKANMYQIFMFNYFGNWFYFDDQELIAPYYFNARRNFSILYTLFSIVWLTISAYILYRHSGFIDRKFKFFK